MWFAQSGWIKGPATVKCVKADGAVESSIDFRYGEIRIIFQLDAARATYEALGAALEAAGQVPVEIVVMDESDEGQPS